MIRSAIIAEDEQVHYWDVVRRCLMAFHGRTNVAADREVSRLQTDVEQLPREEAELFFHAEPFDVACRISGQPLDVVTVLPRYLEIRDGSARAS